MEVASVQQPYLNGDQSSPNTMDASMDIDMDLDLGPLPEPEPIETVSLGALDLETCINPRRAF
jgi:hypothetical protein